MTMPVFDYFLEGHSCLDRQWKDHKQFRDRCSLRIIAQWP